MNNLIDAAIKGWVTSIFGLALMMSSVYCWLNDELTDTQALSLFIIGLTLIFIKENIGEFLKKLLNVVIDKFTGKK